MRWYLRAIGPRKIIEFIVLVVFIILLLGPLLNFALLAITGKWN
jgi:putative spermidine/putrescine transport system permease protein